MTSWRDEAACRGMPGAWWIEEWKELALPICVTCPVQTECLADLIAYQQLTGRILPGIWGGTTTTQRRKARRYGRPVNHGTEYAYMGRQCRCDRCVTGMRALWLRREQRRTG